MTRKSTTEAKLLSKQKYYIRSLIFITVVVLFGLNLGSWLFLRRMDRYLEVELEKRLTSIARLADRLILKQYIDDLLSDLEPAFASFYIKQDLNKLVDQQELQAAYIIDRDFHVLVAAGGTRLDEPRRTYLRQDSAAIALAWQGIIAAAPLHIVAGNRFKNVYAPLRDVSLEVVALLVLEANADFFGVLGVFQRGLIIAGLISFGLIILFAFFVSWMITLLIRNQESLQRTEKLAAMGRMAASMAHEIRNPLGIIKSTADVLKEKYAHAQPADELFDYISDEVKRLNLLVNNFLSFAREPKLNLRIADLNLAVNRAVAAIQREMVNKDIQIRVEPCQLLTPFYFDEDAIHQVLINILLNAIQAIESQGTIEIVLSTTVAKNRPYAILTVIDNGCGIEGDIAQIFEPFYSSKSSGSGLGLTISQQLIRQHGGWIETESSPGHGATFRIFLPMRA